MMADYSTDYCGKGRRRCRGGIGGRCGIFIRRMGVEKGREGKLHTGVNDSVTLNEEGRI
jgi:hypothetical protein